MPKVVEGGKYVYGWVVVGSDGKIPLPEEPRREYEIEGEQDLILIQGSQSSGGFGVSRKETLKASAMGVILERYRELETVPEGKPVLVAGRSKFYARARLNKDNRLELSSEILEAFGVKPGDQLLVLRGSEVTLSFAVTGPVMEEARKHADLTIWE